MKNKKAKIYNINSKYAKLEVDKIQGLEDGKLFERVSFTIAPSKPSKDLTVYFVYPKERIYIEEFCRNLEDMAKKVRKYYDKENLK